MPTPRIPKTDILEDPPRRSVNDARPVPQNLENASTPELLRIRVRPLHRFGAEQVASGQVKKALGELKGTIRIDYRSLALGVAACCGTGFPCGTMQLAESPEDRTIHRSMLRHAPTCPGVWTHAAPSSFLPMVFLIGGHR